MFGGNLLKGKNGPNKIMQYMMMSEMMKGGTGTNNGFGAMLPLMMMNGNMSDMFGDMFDFSDEDEYVEVADTNEEDAE